MRHSAATEQNADHCGFKSYVCSSQLGFTLMETTIALVVMMIIGLAAVSLSLYSINQNLGANQNAATLSVAQTQMEIVRNTAFESLASSTSTVQSAGRSFTVVVTVQNQDLLTASPEAERKLVRVQVTPINSGPWSGGTISLTTLRSTMKPGPNRKPNV